MRSISFRSELWRWDVAGGIGGREHCFFVSPSVVDEGSESEQAGRARERERGTRGKMYQQPSGYQAAGQYDSKYAYDPEMGYGKTEEEGGYATFMEKQVRTDGPSCSRRRASPFLRLTRDPSHHLPSPYYFFFLFSSSSSWPGSARFHQEGFQHPRRPAARDLLVRHRLRLQRAAQGLRFPEHVARLRRLPSHLW